MNARPAIHFLTLIAIGTQHLKIGGEVVFHDPSFRRSVSFPHLLQYLVDSKEITSLPYGHRLPTTLAIHSPQLPQASQIELGNVGR